MCKVNLDSKVFVYFAKEYEWSEGTQIGLGSKIHCLISFCRNVLQSFTTGGILIAAIQDTWLVIEPSFAYSQKVKVDKLPLEETQKKKSLGQVK